MNREGFEKWADDRLGDESNRSICRESWQAAINSLEVTPELVMFARSRLHALSGESISGGTMRILLEHLFTAIKESSNV